MKLKNSVHLYHQRLCHVVTGTMARLYPQWSSSHQFIDRGARPLSMQLVDNTYCEDELRQMKPIIIIIAS